MSTAVAWQERPRDEVSLFNPAFLGLLVERAANGYQERSGAGLPWTLAFLALPVVLHKETREALPSSVNTSMAAWTRDHPLLVGALAPRAQALRPLVSEAVLFSLAHDLIGHEDGVLLARGLRPRRRSEPWREPTEDFRACATKVSFFGRWCALSGLPATVYALWGAKP